MLASVGFRTAPLVSVSLRASSLNDRKERRPAGPVRTRP